MGAYRLLNEQGVVIGSVLLDRKVIEDELVFGQPDLELEYTTTLTNVVSFTLKIIPPIAEDG